MSESSFRRSLTKGVGRRILAMFLLAALLPTIFTAVLAFSEFNRGLETEAAKALRHSAKEYGVEILTRLDLAAEKSSEVVALAEDNGMYSISERDYLLNDFEAIWVVGENGPPMISLGDVSSETSIAMLAVGQLSGQIPRLVLTLRSPGWQ